MESRHATPSDGQPNVDRYITFHGLDCDGKARRIMECIEFHMAGSGSGNPFLKYFMAKRTPKSGPAPDDLFLIHSNLNQIREFLEECDDQASLDLLVQLEEECC